MEHVKLDRIEPIDQSGIKWTSETCYSMWATCFHWGCRLVMACVDVSRWRCRLEFDSSINSIHGRCIGTGHRRTRYLICKTHSLHFSICGIRNPNQLTLIEVVNNNSNCHFIHVVSVSGMILIALSSVLSLQYIYMWINKVSWSPFDAMLFFHCEFCGALVMHVSHETRNATTWNVNNANLSIWFLS